MCFRSLGNLPTGELLLKEAAYAAAIHRDYRRTHCHHCFAPLPLAPLPCRGCCVPSYCSVVRGGEGTCPCPRPCPRPCVVTGTSGSLGFTVLTLNPKLVTLNPKP